MATLMLVGPFLFSVGAWLLDRWIRRGRGSAAKRWFALSLFSGLVLVLLWALTHIPPSWQFAVSSVAFVYISYIIGLSCLSIPLIAVPCLVIGLCGIIISRVVENRRYAASHEV